MSREELEAALRTRWDRDTLAVYADHLQAEGELRGELIIVDLQIEDRGPLPELVAQRKALLAEWLAQLPPGKVQHGFLDVDATGVNPVTQTRAAFASAAAPYIRTAAIAGATTPLRQALAIVAEAPRRGLVRLVVRQWQGSRKPPHGAWIADLIAATPDLQALEVEGFNVLGTEVHPGVQHLRVTGASALGWFGVDGLPAPAVSSLDLAFACLLDRAHYQGPVQLSRKWAARLPGLRVLDLSRNERGYAEPDQLGGSADVFDIFAALDVLAQLERVRLPALRSQRDEQHLRYALARMPALRDLELRAGGYELRAPLAHPTATIRTA